MAINKKIIFLTGQMASGKSYLGKKISDHLNLNFIDTDKYIEEKQRKSINEIFENSGEVFFRQLEFELLNDLLEIQTPSLIATGGGFPCFNNNAERMYENGLVIHLKPAQSLLKENISNGLEHRPILKNQNIDVIDFLKKQYISRSSHYEKAHILVSLKSRNEGYTHLIDRLSPFFKPKM